MKSFHFACTLALAAASSLLPCVTEAGAGEAGKAETALPQALTREDFQGLLERSPFIRSLDLPGTIVLTGVAVLDGSPMATFIDTEDGRSMLISDSPNELGWSLVEVRRMDDLEAAVAIIARGGGETFRAYHDEDLIKNASQRLRFGGGSQAQQLAALGAEDILPDWVNQIEDPVQRGQAIAKMIEGGAFDKSPFGAVNVALSQTDPSARGTVMSAAFGRLGGGVGGVDRTAAVARLNTLPTGRDRDFAINGLAHGLVGSDPQAALKWANSISQEDFRKVVVGNVTRRIEGQSSRTGKR
jgi:hypothetical protein